MRCLVFASLFMAAPLAITQAQEVAEEQAAPQRGAVEDAPQSETPADASEAAIEVQSDGTADANEAVQEPTAAVAAKSIGSAGELKFNFSGTRWLDVLDWFASQADLALQVDEPPVGTFSFSDPTRGYSISEGLDVINLALMKRGYSLVRRGRMLQVIDLELENADKLISEIAELVTPESLDNRGRSDIVSCVFRSAA